MPETENEAWEAHRKAWHLPETDEIARHHFLAGFRSAAEAQAGEGDEPSYSEVLTAAGEAVPMSGDVHEDAKRMEAFVLGAEWEHNRQAGGGLRAALERIEELEAAALDVADTLPQDDSRVAALRALVATPQGEKE